MTQTNDDCGVEINARKLSSFEDENPDVVGSQTSDSGGSAAVADEFRAKKFRLLRRLFSFRGRADQAEFWGVSLTVCAAWWFLLFPPCFGFITATRIDQPRDVHYYLAQAAVFALAFGTLLGGLLILAAAVRRFHDVGLPGWSCFGFFLLIFLLNPGSTLTMFALSPLNVVLQLFGADRIDMFDYRCPETYFATWIVVLTLIVVLLWPGKNGANRYGKRSLENAQTQ